MDSCLGQGHGNDNIWHGVVSNSAVSSWVVFSLGTSKVSPTTFTWDDKWNKAEKGSNSHDTITNELPHDRTNKMACAPSEDSDQPGHPPSLIRVFTVRMKKPWVLSYPLSAQQRLWSDLADAQVGLSHFVGFVMRRLNSFWFCFSSRRRS